MASAGGQAGDHAGRRRPAAGSCDITTEKFTPEAPAPISTAPIRPPNRACEELDGSPSSQVIRFHRIAPTSPAKIIVGVTRASLTMPPEMVLATSVDRNAPATFSTAAISTATFGFSAPVATEVAIAFALSWKPLVKSKNNAVMITIETRNRVVDMGRLPSRRPARWGSGVIDGPSPEEGQTPGTTGPSDLG